jgi:hypothetical protein
MIPEYGEAKKKKKKKKKIGFYLFIRYEVILKRGYVKK